MLGDSKNATNSVPKNLNPEWNVTIPMPINNVNCLLLECVCWDKDRFGKDYLGEFALSLEDVFAGDVTEVEPKWYALRSKRPGSKHSNVSGEVQLQFALVDPMNHAAPSHEVLERFRAIAGASFSDGGRVPNTGSNTASPLAETESDEYFEQEDEQFAEEGPEAAEKRRKRLRLKGLRRTKHRGAYEFSGESDVVGIIFLDIQRITDLPPERNVTRTSFDMDPFVIASVGKKTYRTRVIRHNLNPVFNEKMIFQVLRHEQAYSMSFTVMDRDKLSGNDFVASAVLPLPEMLSTAPEADPETGLYALRDPDAATPPPNNRSRFKLPLSRSASSQSLNKAARPATHTRISDSNGNTSASTPIAVSGAVTPTLGPTSNPSSLQAGDSFHLHMTNSDNEAQDATRGITDLHTFTIPLKLKNAEKWEEKHSPELLIGAKYVPYPALRQQFWRAMLKQYDMNENNEISKVELTTMLDTLGSTLKESTIDSFFKRFHDEPAFGDESMPDLTFDQAVICLEDQLMNRTKQQQSTVGQKISAMIPDGAIEKVKDLMPNAITGAAPTQPKMSPSMDDSPDGANTAFTTPSLSSPNISEHDTLLNQSSIGVETQVVPKLNEAGEEGEYLDRDDLNDKEEEHVIEIRECPICHQPRLNKRSDADIITHIATCASQDWRRVNNIVMGGFVTSSQAQRKWYSKVVTKISYGGYKIGANSANILVQDRITGQINEEKMSVYVRLGIRLLYKGLKSRDMEKRRSKFRSHARNKL